MGNTAIKVENLSKIYSLGEIGTGTISRDMERWFKTKLLKQEDPFLKIGETNDRTHKGTSDLVYSLRDINFEIQQGDAIGIIGRNGAGKSTLLKILSRVTTPTTGRINIRGRVASLLEVGTGFHPELTGRENIYLNGAILGMRKREIDRKLDEIIDFSGVERYIDTPVKRYSSGMYVRLAFAVAAHLESEILIVDEVLAVGDAEFQTKCLGKMSEVSKGEGRTVLFVSHSMAAINKLCNKGLIIAKGYSSRIDNVQKIIQEYSKSYSNNYNMIGLVSSKVDLRKHPDKKQELGITELEIMVDGVLTNIVKTGAEVIFRIGFKKDTKLIRPEFGIVVKDENDMPILGFNNHHLGLYLTSFEIKEGVCMIKFPNFRLYGHGDYFINLYFGDDDIKDYEELFNVCKLQLERSDFFHSGKMLDEYWNKYVEDVNIEINVV